MSSILKPKSYVLNLCPMESVTSCDSEVANRAYPNALVISTLKYECDWACQNPDHVTSLLTTFQSFSCRVRATSCTSPQFSFCVWCPVTISFLRKSPSMHEICKIFSCLQFTDLLSTVSRSINIRIKVFHNLNLRLTRVG